MPSDPHEPPQGGSELTNLLEQLCKTGADFILVGGLAAVSQGAPIATFDIDVVPSSEESNLRKLLDFLGPLDLLGTVEGGLGYDALLGDSSEIQFRGHSLRVLKLEAMIRMKRSSTRVKDQRYLPLLEETLRRSREK